MGRHLWRTWMQVGTPSGTIRRAMPLSRAAWIATVLVALITAALLFLSDYNGYAVLSLAVAASAAINLL